jgi:hypothetical protein
MKLDEDFFVKLTSEEFEFERLAYPSFSARIFISLITRFKLSPIKVNAAIGKRRSARVKNLIKQFHLRHYMHNLLFRGSVTPRNLMYQFILSRADENLRLAIAGVATKNKLAFFMAMRSQLELNAHTYYLTTDEKYAQRFHKSPENRIKQKDNPELFKNILTLVQKFEKRFEVYDGLYDHCSRLIHPNPSTSFEYMKPKKGLDGGINLNINYTFETTWYSIDSEHEDALKWFDSFLGLSRHQLRLFDELDDKIEVDSNAIRNETSMLGFFLDLSRKQELFNLRAKMESWSPEEYEKRHLAFRDKYMIEGNFKKYGLNAKKVDRKPKN